MTGKVSKCIHTHMLSLHIGLRDCAITRFFYLLDYVTLGRISKCGDWKKNKNKN